MKNRFPGFQKCMEMMRGHDPQIQEDGFAFLRPFAMEFVDELIEEFKKETRHGLRCWILELIGDARSPKAFEFLCEQSQSIERAYRDWAMRGLEELDTKESRTFLWQSRNANHE